MAQIRQAALDYEARRWLRPDLRRFFSAGSQNDPLYRYYEGIERKYDSSQPRVPAGQPEGGQWTSGGTSNSSQVDPTKDVRSNVNPKKKPERSTTGSGAQSERPTQIASRTSPGREAECELMQRKDEFICKAFRSRPCYEQAYLRYSNCLSGRSIPPLNF